MSHWILIVDDEQDLVQTLEYILDREGYRVTSVGTGHDAMARLSGNSLPDLVLLDLMLPDFSGIEICKHLRTSDRTRGLPVIMLTAKDEEIDRVVGFEVGADDYVTKPFSVRELLLRIRAVLRRAGESEPDDPESWRFGELTVDVPGHRAWVSGDEINLTPLEFRLLTTLLTRRGRVQSRDRLLSDVWGYQSDITSRTVDTHVKRLREKLCAAGSYVETVRGVGYRFRDRPDLPLVADDARDAEVP